MEYYLTRKSNNYVTYQDVQTLFTLQLTFLRNWEIHPRQELLKA